MTTEPVQGVIPPVGRRVVAYLIDAAIAAVIPLVGTGIAVAAALASPTAEAALSAATGVLVVAGVLMLGWFAVYSLMQSGAGSVGMRSQGLRLVDVEARTPIGWGRALLRNVIFGLAGCVGVGYFSPLFDGSGRYQGWHDLVAKALLIDVRTGATAAHLPISVPMPPTQQGPAPVHADQLIQAVPLSAPQRLTDPAGRPPAAPAPIVFVPGVTDEAPEDTLPRPKHNLIVPAATEPADLDATRFRAPSRRLEFTWDDGTRAVVAERSIFGRDPKPEPGAMLVAVPDESFSLSKTHFEASANAGDGWVKDLHSTNGMTVVRGSVRITCPPGEQVGVRPGDTLEIGVRRVTVRGAD